ncbi:MAG: SDR family NAD(P)-dependent oxidoreductase [Alphaproteobacteria bacterium]|nr:SDR family NAD(P)-dependent oxidoreductase [Alphaproteobacteria bacterium]
MISILITGASSGIGEAVALAYAERYGTTGCKLALSGRDADRLDAVAKACRGKGAEVTGTVLNVTDQTAMRDWIEAVDTTAPLDIVIANAGISGGDEEESVRKIFDVNLTGVLNTVHPALDRMLARGHGTIGMVSSIAGNRGLPSAPAYSASKAAVLAYGEGLRGRFAGHGVTVCVICPGFVRSRITDANSFKMPFFMEADRAARIIMDGLSQGRAKISFPWQMRLIGWLLRALPSGICTRLLSRLPEKE